jgi:hypothetical protein
MIQQLEKAISKLSESEQEKIAQMIMTTIENKKEEKNGYMEDDPLAELRNSDLTIINYDFIWIKEAWNLREKVFIIKKQVF